MSEISFSSRPLDYIPARYANRHGLITGPTGTGKSVTLMRLAESMSEAGIPVFLADVKGDLSALSRLPGARRLDPFGRVGAPVRASLSDMGPDLIARALELSDAQAGTVEVACHIARTTGRRLDSVADMRALLAFMLANREGISATVGQVSPASIGVVQRALLRLDSGFIGAPGFDVAELLEPERVSIMDSVRLMRSPRLYSALLMHLLNELSERLPEVGDRPAPRLAFFFDEAHLLFRDVPQPLLTSIEQTVRLIRSKGVGIYFASQSPLDVPVAIREQLAHRFAHEHRYGVGRALVSTMGPDGRPREVGLVQIAPPKTPLGAVETVPAPVAAPEPAEPVTGQPSAVSGSPWISAALGASIIGLAVYGIAVAFDMHPGIVAACMAGAALALFPTPKKRRR